ncbi:MAG: serine/threonine-protein kinase PknK, partial [Chloroflexi bacterium]|nr:serine/threonine-protein kinase PknK [Chloroflexota bacterium]
MPLKNITYNSRYHLHEKLGEGDMGIVYRATDRLTGATMPSKLHITISSAPNVTESSPRLALTHEFQTLAGLHYPHIISVLDYGFDEKKRPFSTMDYLPHTQTLLEAGQEANQEHKIKFLQQLLQALANLHRHGILHRDLKPENVLVTNGAVRVLDFGLASSRRSSQGASVGTPLYLAPEIWDEAEYTISADLFAIGVLACQLITGRHSFNPDDHNFLNRLLEAEPSLEHPDMTAALAQTIGRLLSKSSQAHYTSAEETMVALSQAMGQPLPKESTAVRESYLQAATFVGRETEMAQLQDALTKAIDRQGSAWLLGGESGVGKSRLTNELRINALVNGCLVLRGQGVRDSGGTSYQLWRESLLILEDLQWTQASLELLPDLLWQLDKVTLLLGNYRDDEWPDLPQSLPGMQIISLPRLSADNMAELSAAM